MLRSFSLENGEDDGDGGEINEIRGKRAGFRKAICFCFTFL